jgi:hypothetical protein
MNGISPQWLESISSDSAVFADVPFLGEAREEDDDEDEPDKDEENEADFAHRFVSFQIQSTAVRG